MLRNFIRGQHEGNQRNISHATLKDALSLPQMSPAPSFLAGRHAIALPSNLSLTETRSQTLSNSQSHRDALELKLSHTHAGRRALKQPLSLPPSFSLSQTRSQAQRRAGSQTLSHTHTGRRALKQPLSPLSLSLS
eukprot:c19804_g1_i1 orf=2-403(-)